tara:strand:+ start:897 stop:1694 length:798 start_codon:yes stop_codon:yes gene_type:complete
MITNSPSITNHIVDNGVQRIFIDLEKIGKNKRQSHLNTWISDHEESDIKLIQNCVNKAELLVRINPLNKYTKDEIDRVVSHNVDYIMMPMINCYEDVQEFLSLLQKRAKFIPLIETKNSINDIERILNDPQINEVYIGLNDLRISMKSKFLFEPLINGLLEETALKLNKKNIKWGFGGIARSGRGEIPCENILGEHIRLGSTNVILSRSFHSNFKTLEELNKNINFKEEILKLRQSIKRWENSTRSELLENKLYIKKLIEKIILN